MMIVVIIIIIGIRRGACNLLGKFMPCEFAVSTTGHETKSVSAFYECMDMDIAQLMPGAVVLSGWPPIDWGKLGNGPIPASLDAVSSIVDAYRLDDMADDVFGLNTTSPPMLSRNKALRPAVMAALASLIMYYGDRESRGYMRPVNASLRDAWRRAYRLNGVGNGDADAALKA